MPDLRPCECGGCANVFDEGSATGDLRRYAKNGPDKSTRALVDAVVAQGMVGGRVLDIGGGVGAVQLELLAAGVATTEAVDASAAYVAVARTEAVRRGFGDRTTYHVGDFVRLAPEVQPADAVTLDRMVCCYSDMPALVDRAADHAERVIALVYPRDAWWTRLASAVMNAFDRLTRSPFRWYIHSETALDARIRTRGFERRFLRRFLLWQVAVYVRVAPAPA